MCDTNFHSAFVSFHPTFSQQAGSSGQEGITTRSRRGGDTGTGCSRSRMSCVCAGVRHPICAQYSHPPFTDTVPLPMLKDRISGISQIGLGWRGVINQRGALRDEKQLGRALPSQPTGVTPQRPSCDPYLRVFFTSEQRKLDLRRSFGGLPTSGTASTGGPVAWRRKSRVQNSVGSIGINR